MTKHDTIYRSEGPETESGTRTPSCSCGWEGASVDNYNDYQFALLKAQIDEHLQEEGATR